MKRIVLASLFTASLLVSACGNSEPAREAAQEAVEAHEAVPMAPNLHKANEEARKGLTGIYTHYLHVKDALVKTDAAAAQKAAADLVGNMTVDDALLNGDEKTAWEEQLPVLKQAAETIAATANVAEQRAAFHTLSTAMEKSIMAIGLHGTTVYKQYCPMAFDDTGAYWLAGEEEVNNPYFGDEMLHCGSTEIGMAF